MRLNSLEGNNAIREMLLSDKPGMVTRLGKVEAECLSLFLQRHPWTDHVRGQLQNNAGFFPVTDDMMYQFCNEFLDHIKNADVIALWLDHLDDVIANNFCPKALKVELRSLEPYYHDKPWSTALSGKKVLVVHPFEESIKSQYNKRKLLFKNPDILPDFELITVKAVQSCSGNPVPFQTWFEAYQYMRDEIIKQDFDIALIGAGAYGLPLASFIKRLGRKVVHIAGATQILFGIKGLRWDDHEDISKLYNEHWVRPSHTERPEKFQSVEGGCYW